MAREGIQSCGELGIRAVALPEQTDTYTVISHGFIIDKVREELTKNNFEIEREEFLYSYGGQVVLSKVHIKSSKDPDMGMVFTWWNSYNKQVKFGCAIGGFIYDNKTSLIGSDGMSWIRKHTGTADTEASNIMEQLIAHANVYFDKIIAEKETMKAMPLSIESFGCIMGALYFELELISPTQASLVRQEYKKPKHEYKDKDTLWGLYKLIMFGIDEMDLRKWATNQQKIHFTIMNEYLIATERENVPEEKELKLEDVLPQARIDTYVDQGFIEAQVVQHTDPAGNTFELVNPKTNEELVAEYNATHDDSHMNIEYLSPEEVKEKYGQEIVIHVESDEEYVQRVAKIEGEPEVETKMPQEIMDALMNAPEMDASEVDMSKVTSVDAPDPTTLFRNESATSFDDIVNDLSEIENVVEVVETKTELPSGFEWLLGDDIEESDEIINEGLEIPDNLKELASKIETRMQELYGCIKPYNYKETSKYCVVTINNTNEVFYI